MKRTLLASIALMGLAGLASAEPRVITGEAYPYYKTAEAQGVRGYALYPLHGCTDYEQVPGGSLRQICNRRSATEILRTMDKEGLGDTGAAE